MFYSSSAYVVNQSHEYIRGQLNLNSSIRDFSTNTINSKSLLPRTLHFVSAKDPRNSVPPRSLSTSTSSTVSPNKQHRQHSDFNAPSHDLFSEDIIQQLSDWKSPSKTAGSGLRNLGNSCFMNATLQCLCYTSAFQNYISSKYHKKKCKIAGYCILCELEKLFPAMLHAKYAQIPGIIFRNLRTLSVTLRAGRQEDAHEFLRHLMDGMQTSVLKQQPMKITDMRVQETSAIHRIWGGYLRSQVKCCKCGFESNTYETILDLSLEIKGSSVQSALKNFTDPELLDGENKYKCNHCKKLRRAVKQFTIFEPPNSLVLHLKRFSYSRSVGNMRYGNKINTFVEFNEILDITDRMSYRTCTQVTYTLFGVLVHHGYSANGGHYVSYVRAPNDQWWLMDDSRCSSVTLSNVLQQQAYILFYKRNESKVLYVSPQTTPKKKLLKKNSNSISTFDKLQELRNIIEFNVKHDLSPTLPKSKKKRSPSINKKNSIFDHYMNNSNHSSSKANHMKLQHVQKNTKDIQQKKNDQKTLLGKKRGLKSHLPSSPLKKRRTKFPILVFDDRKDREQPQISSQSSDSSAIDISSQLKLLKKRHSLQTTSLQSYLPGRRSTTIRLAKQSSYHPRSRRYSSSDVNCNSLILRNTDDSSSDSILSDFNTLSELKSSPIISDSTVNDQKRVKHYLSAPLALSHKQSVRNTSNVIRKKQYLSNKGLNSYFENLSKSNGSSIGLSNVGQWNSGGRNDCISTVYHLNEPIVAKKDEWDIALDSGVAFPKKPKNRKDSFFQMNRFQRNAFQSEQNFANDGKMQMHYYHRRKKSR